MSRHLVCTLIVPCVFHSVLAGRLDSRLLSLTSNSLQYQCDTDCETCVSQLDEQQCKELGCCGNSQRGNHATAEWPHFCIKGDSKAEEACETAKGLETGLCIDACGCYEKGAKCSSSLMAMSSPCNTDCDTCVSMLDEQQCKELGCCGNSQRGNHETTEWPHFCIKGDPKAEEACETAKGLDTGLCIDACGCYEEGAKCPSSLMAMRSTCNTDCDTCVSMLDEQQCKELGCCGNSQRGNHATAAWPHFCIKGDSKAEEACETAKGLETGLCIDACGCYEKGAKCPSSLMSMRSTCNTDCDTCVSMLDEQQCKELGCCGNSQRGNHETAEWPHFCIKGDSKAEEACETAKAMDTGLCIDACGCYEKGAKCP